MLAAARRFCTNDWIGVAAMFLCLSAGAGALKGAVGSGSARGLRTALPCAVTTGIKVAPPPEGLYHAAFPFFSSAASNEDYVTAARLKAFEQTAGKTVAWAYFSNNWYRGRIQFPAAAAETIWNAGRIPFIRMMPRSADSNPTPDPIFSMQKIIDGDFDLQLIPWALAAKSSGIPLMVEFGTEVNGDWFAWNSRWNGGGATDGYGDPDYPDGPERFRDAYRHIVDLFRAQGVHNITWVFHVDAAPGRADVWNAMRYYYPGESYVDWLGVSVYGATEHGEAWVQFRPKLRAAYAEITRLSTRKPIAILEYGVVQDVQQGSKAAWIESALNALQSGAFPRVKAAAWWQERYFNDAETGWADIRIESSPKSLQTYRQGVANNRFTSTAAYECRP